jgi:flagellin-like hook-associated protein FlgL
LNIELAGAVSVQDVLDRINNHALNTNPATKVTARLAQFGNGIELVNDNPTGSSTLSVEATFGSTAAVELGLIPSGSTTADVTTPAQAATATLNFPVPNQLNTALTLTANTRGTGLNGVNVVLQNTLSGDLATATFNAGTNTLTISLDITQTSANTVIGAVNTEGTFSASLDTTNDASNDGTGLIASTGTLATTAGGTAETLTGSDTKPIEVTGAFTALIRLRQALVDNNTSDIQRSVELLDASLEQLSFVRGELGSRSQTLDSLKTRLSDEEIELKSNLSQEIDVDFAEALSNLTARQAAYQATLQLSAQIYQNSLLDYL